MSAPPPPSSSALEEQFANFSVGTLASSFAARQRIQRKYRRCQLFAGGKMSA